MNELAERTDASSYAKQIIEALDRESESDFRELFSDLFTKEKLEDGN